ncbi:hypothetical protein CDAR_81361 [Caerostris darwini]|uniref:Uncharacterized protein n=1 Tax=Caerostris darwini TaxID=1538125 RepID=A0AAV4M4K5_9ARAC|nr:hypothetical protein CDAR_81361 [Caerostris darwini]
MSHINNTGAETKDNKEIEKKTKEKKKLFESNPRVILPVSPCLKKNIVFCVHFCHKTMQVNRNRYLSYYRLTSPGLSKMQNTLRTLEGGIILPNGSQRIRRLFESPAVYLFYTMVFPDSIRIFVL